MAAILDVLIVFCYCFLLLNAFFAVVIDKRTNYRRGPLNLDPYGAIVVMVQDDCSGETHPIRTIANRSIVFRSSLFVQEQYFEFKSEDEWLNTAIDFMIGFDLGHAYSEISLWFHGGNKRRLVAARASRWQRGTRL